MSELDYILNPTVTTQVFDNLLHKDLNPSKDKIRIDVSRLKVWKDCQLKDYLSYGRMLQPHGSPHPESPLVFGSIGHEGMDGWYAPDTYHSDTAALNLALTLLNEFMEKDFFKDEHVAKWGVLVSDMTECLTSYFDHYRDEQMTPICSEMPFAVELLDNQIELFGKVDNVMEYQGENDIKPMIYFMENKFYKNIPTDLKYLSWDFQVSVYYLVGKMMYGDRFGGILYNIIRKKKPVKAEVSMFYRQEIKRSTNEVKATLKFVAVQAMQMQYVYAHGSALIVPLLDSSPMYNNICKGCVFNFDVCNAFRSGEDWEEILQANYETKDMSYSQSSEDDVS